MQRERLKLEGEEILSTLRRIQLQLECAQSAFEDVTDESLIDSYIYEIIRFLYKGIIIKHNKTEPTYTKTSLFLCEKRRFFMARTEKGVVTTI